MNQLYPIIRRVRRPLMPEEPPVVAVPAALPAQTNKAEEVRVDASEPAELPERQESDLNEPGN